MKLEILDLNPWVCRAFKVAFKDDTNVSVHVTDIFGKGGKVFATPGNSYGWMDGGIDLAFAQRFPGLEGMAQRAAKDTEAGEILVGQAVCLEDGETSVIYAPTMRVPRRIADPYDIRLAVRAVFRVARERGFETIKMPAFGALTGGVDFDTVAAMYKAEWQP